MGSIKMILINLSAGQQQRHRHREDLWTRGRRGKERVGRMERTAWKHAHHRRYNSQPVGMCCMTRGAHVGAL